jgi:hypothetical protein
MKFLEEPKIRETFGTLCKGEANLWPYFETVAYEKQHWRRKNLDRNIFDK